MRELAGGVNQWEFSWCLVVERMLGAWARGRE